MDYARKLLISKILITVAMIVFTTMPLLAQLHWTSVGNIIATPVLLYVLWGKLHGTGRSVRLVAFLGLAYVVGYFLSVTKPALGAPPEYMSLFGLIFVLLTLGILFSIKRNKNPE